MRARAGRCPRRRGHARLGPKPPPKGVNRPCHSDRRECTVDGEGGKVSCSRFANIGGVSLLLFGSTFLWLTPAFVTKGLSTEGLWWSITRVLALATLVGFTVATWGLFRRDGWWERVNVGPQVSGVERPVRTGPTTPVTGSRRAGRWGHEETHDDFCDRPYPGHTSGRPDVAGAIGRQPRSPERGAGPGPGVPPETRWSCAPTRAGACRLPTPVAAT